MRIVAETEEAGARVTEVAARHNIYPGLLFTWRRQARDGLLVAPPAAPFIPVRMLASDTSADLAIHYPVNDERSAPTASSTRPAEMVEITLANGCRLRVAQLIDARALRRIVGVLRG